jgi:hypothetical protein
MLESYLLRGAPEPPPEPMELRAGHLQLLFEPGSGMIRRISYGDVEVWRGLYAAVRDHNWGTIAPRVFNLQVKIDGGFFEISFDMECKGGAVDFLWHGVIRGDSSSSIEYHFRGEARSDFRRNRIGFCLLHPPQCAGQRCELTHADGAREMLHFPRDIAPHQPFLNLRAMRHEAADGLWAEAAFEGDIFETEDQRNWSDASFKTYCTPLALPFPVEVKKGDIVEQKVTLRLDPNDPLAGHVYKGGALAAQPKQPGPITIEPLDKSIALPKIGVCMASHGEPLTLTEIRRLKELHLAHLRSDLRFGGDWQARLSQAVNEATALNTSLELALHLPPEPQSLLRELSEALEQHEIPVARFLVFSEGEKVTTEAMARAAREVLSAFGAPLVGGTDFYFTEINRTRPPLDLLDGVCFSITPQVHAFDDKSLMETLETQATVVENARRFCGGLPIHVTPVTFKKRRNSDATGANLEGAPDELPPDVDARQMSLFGAAWTLGSLKALTEAGAASVTYYETTGMKGVMQQENAKPHPCFPAPSASVYPLFDVLAAANNLHPGTLCSSSNPSLVQGWSMFEHDAFWLWLVNFSPHMQLVDLPEIKRGTVTIWDETTVKQAMTSPKEFAANFQNFSGAQLALQPYAIALFSWMKSSQ